jgi:hypothetical protein
MAGRNEDLTVQDALDTFPAENPPQRYHYAITTAIAPRERTKSLLQFPRERILVRPRASNSFVVALAIVTTLLIAVVVGLAPSERALLQSTMAASWVPLAIATPRSRTTPQRQDTMEIQRVLNRYRDAFSVLDVATVQTVWPSADEDTLRQNFAGLYDQNVEFDSCQIAIAATAVTADAFCRGYVSYVRNDRVKRRRTEARQWQFSLMNDGVRWIIRTASTF